MTDDRANLPAGEAAGMALDPLTGGGFQRIRVVRKHTLKTSENEPAG